ncbi:hypothetical protein ACFE04_019764 [Oxalis oulophora]
MATTISGISCTYILSRGPAFRETKSISGGNERTVVENGTEVIWRRLLSHNGFTPQAQLLIYKPNGLRSVQELRTTESNDTTTRPPSLFEWSQECGVVEQYNQYQSGGYEKFINGR